MRNLPLDVRAAAYYATSMTNMNTAGTADKYEIIDAARTLLRLMRHADQPTLDAAFQALANSANDDSEYAAHLEPYQGICEAFAAEGRRRAYQQRGDASDMQEDELTTGAGEIGTAL